MASTVFHVSAKWDRDGRTWVAISDDIPGLVTGAPSKDALSEKLTHLVPACFSVSGKALPPDLRYEILVDYEEAGDAA